MTSKIVVNNIEPDAGVSTVTVNGDLEASNFVGLDASTLKNGSDVKVQANASGAVVTGILTATGGVGIGTTTTAGRNAGVGTDVGTIIFNSTSNQLQVYDDKLVRRGF